MDRELPTGEIAAQFDVSWSAVSQHLRVLTEAGFVAERRAGTSCIYRAGQAALGSLRSVVEDHWRWGSGASRTWPRRAFTLEVLATAGAVGDAELQAFLAGGYTAQNALEVVLGIGAYTMSTLAGRMVRAPLDDQLKPFAWHEASTA